MGTELKMPMTPELEMAMTPELEMKLEISRSDRTQYATSSFPETTR
jgi:hypothetical protein